MDIKTFFEEKDLPLKQWEIKDGENNLHIIDTKAVIKFLIANPNKQVKETLRKIDVMNGDLYPFLFHMAKFIVEQDTI